MKEIVMPQFGETSVEEMTLVTWLKKVGDKVGKAETLFTVETAKVCMEVEAAETGTLSRIVVEEGETVKPGTIVGYLE